MMRYLALDIGERRIGLALGDSSSRLAVPLRTHHRGKDRAADLTAIAATAGAEGVDAYVIGLPLLESGVEGAQVRAVRAFARALSIASPLPVHWQDERYTTFEAGQRLGPVGGSRRKQQRRREEELDAMAAAVLLQAFLDGLGGGDERHQ